MKFSKLMAASAAALVFTSCIDHKDNDLEYKMSYSNFLNYVEDLNTGDSYYYAGVGYQATYNATNMLADFSISALTLPVGTYTTLNFNQVPWTVNDSGWYCINLSETTPTSTMIAPTFNSLVFNVIDRYILSGTYYPATKVSYRIGSQYQVYSYPSSVVNIGTTSVKNVTEGTTYNPSQSEEVTYVITLYDASTPTNLNEANNRKADFILYNVKLNSSMTAVNLGFEGVPYNCYTGGSISIAGRDSYQVKEISSNSGTIDYKDYVVTEAFCTTDASNNMTLSITMTSEKEGKTYNIIANSSAPSL